MLVIRLLGNKVVVEAEYELDRHLFLLILHEIFTVYNLFHSGKSRLRHIMASAGSHICRQWDEVGGSNERCLLTSNFGANKRSRVSFDCHILAPVKQLLN